MKEYRDKLGQLLTEGDVVVFIPPGIKHMEFGTISHFSTKQVTIEYTKRGVTKRSSRFLGDIIKIDQDAYVQYKLIGSFT